MISIIEQPECKKIASLKVNY